MPLDLVKNPHPLNIFFGPESVAVIGATERAGSVARTILGNLIGSPFGGTVYPINPKHKCVLGVRSYPNLAELPERAELALIATPGASVPGVLRECADRRIKGVIVISAGFRETGPGGAELERQAADIAQRAGIRLERSRSGRRFACRLVSSDRLSGNNLPPRRLL